MSDGRKRSMMETSIATSLFLLIAAYPLREWNIYSRKLDAIRDQRSFPAAVVEPVAAKPKKLIRHDAEYVSWEMFDAERIDRSREGE